MANFCRVLNGYVNLDYVAKIIEKIGRRGEPVEYVLFDRKDRELGYFFHNILLGEIVPAAPGMFAVIIGCELPEDDSQPTIEDVWVNRYPIIAWRVERDVALPVVPGWHDVDDLMIELPDGGIDSPYVEYFPSLEAAKDQELHEAVEKWKKEQQSREEAAE